MHLSVKESALLWHRTCHRRRCIFFNTYVYNAHVMEKNKQTKKQLTIKHTSFSQGVINWKKEKNKKDIHRMGLEQHKIIKFIHYS